MPKLPRPSPWLPSLPSGTWHMYHRGNGRFRLKIARTVSTRGRADVARHPRVNESARDAGLRASARSIFDLDDASKEQAPVFVDEFERALLAAWRPIHPSKILHRRHEGPVGPQPHRIAIAVSGGSDSMALAYLCKQLETRRPLDFHFHAIVINHNARPGSLKEAKDVVMMLRELGIDASVKSIDWSAIGHQPSEVKNFETRARLARYNAIGRFCDQKGVRYLLLGHHQDDQIETVLVRLLSGYTGAGLGGMKQRAAIPASRELFGVSEGPAKDMFYIPLKNKLPETWASSTRPVGRESVMSIASASEGISMHRPLLGFGKSRLVATCVAAGVGWKEDPTNRDVQLTPRNAIRSLLMADRLPCALRKASILQMARKVSTTSTAIDKEATEIFAALTDLNLDPRSGVLRVKLPRAVLLQDSGADQTRSTLVAVTVIQRLSSLVVSHEGTTNFEALTRQVLALATAPSAPSMARNFTGAGMLWERLDAPRSETYRISRQPFTRDRSRAPLCGWKHSLDEGERLRRLDSIDAASSRPPDSRVDMRRADQSRLSTGTPAETPAISEKQESSSEYEASKSEASESSEGVGMRPSSHDLHSSRIQFAVFGKWRLWDGRFWLRVWAGESQSIICRPLTPLDLDDFRRLIPSKERKVLDGALNASAPGQTRFTLPVLVDMQGRPLAIPTVGYVRDEADTHLRWDWMYMHINSDSYHPNFRRYKHQSAGSAGGDQILDPEQSVQVVNEIGHRGSFSITTDGS